MTAAVKAVLKQAKRLSPEELAELRAELDALDEDPAWPRGGRPNSIGDGPRTR